MAITYGRVPHPDFVDLQHTTADKIEGHGYDNLGKRSPKFIALHRMWGTLLGTDSFFDGEATPALTDYGLGVAAVDGPLRDGEIHKYNDPLGYRSGWASGRVSDPYGDGLAIVEKYGIIAVNRDGISVEIAGYDNEPVEGLGWSELVALCAYWIDFMKIPYTSLPLNPHTGINALIWHHEFTRGTGKLCPFTWVKANTNRLYDAIVAYLKPFQEGTKGMPVPAPAPVPVVAPQWAKPVPIEALAFYSDEMAKSTDFIVLDGGSKFIFVDDEVEATVETPRLQFANTNAKSIGPKVKAGERFNAVWLVEGQGGEWFYITKYWSRIRARDTKRVND